MRERERGDKTEREENVRGDPRQSNYGLPRVPLGPIGSSGLGWDHRVQLRPDTSQKEMLFEHTTLVNEPTFRICISVLYELLFYCNCWWSVMFLCALELCFAFKICKCRLVSEFTIYFDYALSISLITQLFFLWFFFFNVDLPLTAG